jgi:protein-tyrosine phosphatase
MWLGPHSVGRSEPLLAELSITDIVIVQSSVSAPERDLLRPRFPEDIKYHPINMDDIQIVSNMKRFHSFIHVVTEIHRFPDRVILVLGLTGMNRSASLIAAFLIQNFGLSLHESLDYLMSRRRCISISPSLSRQLAEFQASLVNSISADQRTKRSRDDMREPMQTFSTPN